MHRILLLLAPAVALALGVWAEFAELTPALLSAVAIPAIVVSTWSAAQLVRLPRPVALVLAGVIVGTITFGITEGTYLAIHLARGGRLNFEGADTQRDMAFALLGIHLGVGAVIGAGVGVALAVLAILGRRFGVLGQGRRLHLEERV